MDHRVLLEPRARASVDAQRSDKQQEEEAWAAEFIELETLCYDAQQQIHIAEGVKVLLGLPLLWLAGMLGVWLACALVAIVLSFVFVSIANMVLFFTENWTRVSIGSGFMVCMTLLIGISTLYTAILTAVTLWWYPDRKSVV